jgi:hypothetical protein
MIIKNDYFDPLFSILYYLEEIPLSVKKDLITFLNNGLKFLKKAMERNQILTMDSNVDHRRSL